MTGPELGILADDLTGASDTGLQFAKSGRRTSVCLSWPVHSTGDVLVIDADSRNRAPLEARSRAVAATRALRVAGAKRLYKKVDSTGRGNLGAEIDGMLGESGATLALICPAFPALGRTVHDGRILVNGVPLSQTEFASDPLWPATSAVVETILHRQTALRCEAVDLATVRRGPSAVRSRLTSAIDSGVRLIVADAETALDLRCLAEAVRQLGDQALPVGSAGLAEWLVSALSRPAHPLRALGLPAGPILIVSGTTSRTGLVQLARLIDRGAGFVGLSPEGALDDPVAAGDEVAGAVIERLRTTPCVALGLFDPRGVSPDYGELAGVRGLELTVATDRLVRALARATERAVSAATPAALVLTGGDTARAVCAALGTQSLEIHREVAPGVPLSLLQGGPWDGLPVVTKAGAFGTMDTLARLIRELEVLRA